MPGVQQSLKRCHICGRMTENVVPVFTAPMVLVQACVACATRLGTVNSPISETCPNCHRQHHPDPTAK